MIVVDINAINFISQQREWWFSCHKYGFTIDTWLEWSPTLAYKKWFLTASYIGVGRHFPSVWAWVFNFSWLVLFYFRRYPSIGWKITERFMLIRYGGLEWNVLKHHCKFGSRLKRPQWPTVWARMLTLERSLRIILSHAQCFSMSHGERNSKLRSEIIANFKFWFLLQAILFLPRQNTSSLAD